MNHSPVRHSSSTGKHERTEYQATKNAICRFEETKQDPSKCNIDEMDNLTWITFVVGLVNGQNYIGSVDIGGL
jgi:hypothetical protein